MLLNLVIDTYLQTGVTAAYITAKKVQMVTVNIVSIA